MTFFLMRFLECVLSMTWTKCFAVLLAVQLVATPLAAQMAAGAGQRDYSIGPDVWPKFFAAYQMPDVPYVVEGNSPRLDELIHDGKMYLSLSDAIALALENNLDVAVSRFTRQVAEAEILRAKTGASVQGAQGGISSLSTGSSSTATSGVAGRSTARGDVRGGTSSSTGASGATGSVNLDPVLIGSVAASHNSAPVINSVTTGTNSFVNDDTSGSVGISKGFLTGGSAALSWNARSSLTNSLFDTFNPSTRSSLTLSVSQPLLRGFGKRLNTISIRVARNNLDHSDLQFKQQVISTVSRIQSLYWDLVRFRAEVESSREDLRLARQLYEGNRQRMEIGKLAPIDLIEPEAEVAQREQDLTFARTAVRQQEGTLKTALSRNGLASPSLATVEIIPTDHADVPEVLEIEPLDDLTHLALISRPDIAQMQIQLENADIQLERSRDSLLPSVNLVASMTNNGLAGEANRIQDSGIPAFFVGGLGRSLGQVLRRNFPDYSVGLEVRVPIRNRRAQADVTRTLLERRRSQMSMQQQVNNVRREVQSAVVLLEQAHIRYLAARTTRELREKMLEGEEQRFLLGYPGSDTFKVVARQRTLATARANEIITQNEFVTARSNLDQVTGQTLAVNNISLDEAYEGRVSKAPDPIPVSR